MADGSASARIIGRPFPKGVSGNPGGLPAGVAGRIMRARRLALKQAPRAIATLAALLGDEDPRVRIAAAEGLLDRAGLRPYSLEPERHEVAVATVDVEALRASLAVRVAALALAEAPALPAAATEVDVTLEASAASPQDAQAPVRTARPLPADGNRASEGPEAGSGG
jgi:hypothetical protein